MQFITIMDYLLLPFYLVVIFIVANGFRSRHYPPGHPWRPYFMPALTVKIFGAIFIGLIYQYYYGGGDTANYFYHAKVLNEALWEDPVKGIKLILRIPEWYDGAYSDYISRLFWYNDKTSYTVGAIAAVVNVFTFNTFLISSVLFACISFTGIWAFFRIIAIQYPKIQRPIAICILFIPSVFVWGSGIFKDSVCLFGVGWIMNGVFQLLILRKIKLRDNILMAISVYFISIIKIYILLAFIPALLFWVFLTYASRIKSIILKFTFTLVLLGSLGLMIYFTADGLSAELGKYSLDNVLKTSQVTRDYILRISGDEGSGYTLGDIDPSLNGILSKIPAAINVTLFRPYIWEARKPIIFINALESLAILLLTLRVIIKVGIPSILKIIRRNPNVQFCLIFSIIFAFAIGVSTYNFGSLSRYRIPCLPFYVLALTLIFYEKYPPEVNFFKL